MTPPALRSAERHRLDADQGGRKPSARRPRAASTAAIDRPARFAASTSPSAAPTSAARPQWFARQHFHLVNQPARPSSRWRREPAASSHPLRFAPARLAIETRPRRRPAPEDAPSSQVRVLRVRARGAPARGQRAPSSPMRAQRLKNVPSSARSLNPQIPDPPRIRQQASQPSPARGQRSLRRRPSVRSPPLARPTTAATRVPPQCCDTGPRPLTPPRPAATGRPEREASCRRPRAGSPRRPGQTAYTV